MFPHPRFRLAWLILIGAATPCSGQESTHTGEHFRLVCHFENEPLAAEASKTAEATWPVAASFLAVDDRAPEQPFEIHLFRTLEDYEKADAQLTNGQFRENLAFSHWESQAAYILLQPDCSDGALERLGLPAQTRRLIAHEAAHLVRYARMPNHRSHPAWLADGMATLIEEEVMTKGGWSMQAEEDPTMSTLIHRTVALLDKGELPSVAEILQDDIDSVHQQTRYGLRWLLLRFLRHSLDHAEFRSIMNETRRLGGASDYTRRLNAFVKQTLGLEVLKTIDARFAAYLRALSPRWEEVYRSLETAGESWTHIAFSNKNAVAWRTKPIGKDAYAIEGELMIAPGFKQQLNLLLGRSPEGFVSVAFVAGSGVTVFHYHAKDNRWERLGSASSELLKRDRWTPFRIEIEGNQMRVLLDKTPTLTVALNGRSMGGPWGLGAQNGSAGMWRNVKLK